ncbi:type II toxin-antitoxin system Phd/YefM family antitoxin [Thiomicrorhabdus sediminis]|nr:type II toxin-antitoxin system Phd/YefM family antitoxin [Thiomicrorhabdus sediminis]
MKTISFKEFEKDLARTLDQMHESQDPILITRPKKDLIVVMSQNYYNSMMETLYLMQSPNNTKRLLDSISSLNNRD